MNPLDALIRILQLDRTQTLVSAVQDAKLPQVQIGQRVAARVDAQLSDGNFKVSIENQPLQMNLPQGTKAGNVVDLVLISREPRLTFQLDQPQTQPQAELSQAGRLISQLLPDASKPNTPLTSAKPVLPSPPQEPRQLALALQNTLSKSGLFYESHQAQWVMGQRPIEQLLQEPQNAISNPAPSSEPQIQQQTAQSSTDSSVKSSPDSAQLKIKDSALPVVRQQIETLETHEFNWNGQIWPGQNLEWQIREERQEGHAEGEPPSAWQSRLKLILPALGQVDANLRLTPAGVQIALQVQKPEAEDQLKVQGKALQDSLKARGISLLSMTVKHD